MNPTNDPQIILITGIMAAGKSTVAQHLAERLPNSVHLRGDVFRRMIVNGQATMDFALSTAAYEQLRLRYKIAATAAKQYIEAGFTVVYQDIIIGSDLANVVAAFRDYRLHVVVLCPAPDVAAERDAARAKTGYSNAAAVEDFDHVLRTETPRIGLWLDTSALSVAATVDHILANLPASRV